jgi:hypothetical protein
MTLLTMTTWFLSLLAVFLATGAIAATRRGSVVSLSKQLSTLSERVAASEAVCEHLVHDLKGIRLARNMAAYRERTILRLADELKTSDQPLDEDAKAKLRAELNAKLASGNASALKPGV